MFWSPTSSGIGLTTFMSPSGILNLEPLNRHPMVHISNFSQLVVEPFWKFNDVTSCLLAKTLYMGLHFVKWVHTKLSCGFVQHVDWWRSPLWSFLRFCKPFRLEYFVTIQKSLKISWQWVILKQNKSFNQNRSFSKSNFWDA